MTDVQSHVYEDKELFIEDKFKKIMSKSRLNQLVTFIITIMGIILLYLGGEFNIPMLSLSALIVLIIGFVFMIITSRSIFNG
jgi:hypothetical protein